MKRLAAGHHTRQADAAARRSNALKRLRYGAMLLLALAAGAASAGRPVHESLSGVLARSPQVVVAEVLGIDELDTDPGQHAIAVEARLQELLRGPAPEQDTVYCRYTEMRVQRRGDAVISPLVSGSGQEFGLRRGQRVILLLAPQDASGGTPGSIRADHADAQAAVSDADDSGESAAEPAQPDCVLLRAEPLQSRREILRLLQPPQR